MKSDVKKNRKKFRLTRLFRNNQFVLVVSLLISIVIWIVFNLSDGNEASTTIVNIPVNITLSEESVNDGLKIFSGEEQFASVSVTGNRVALGGITSEDIIVNAEGAGNITTPGTYPLSLIATKANSSDNFDITSSVSPSVITIFVDHGDKEKFEIQNNLVYKVKDGYYANVALSHKNVTIEGPGSEVSKIKTVAIEGNINGHLQESRQMECEIKLYDHSGNLYNNNMLHINNDKVSVKFTVEPEKKVPIKINYLNMPTGISIEDYVTLSPSSVLISGPQEIIDKTELIYTDDVDFADISNSETNLKLEFDVPEKCSNLSEVNEVEATFDFRGFQTRTISVSDFAVNNLPEEYRYTLTTQNLDITLIGRKNDLKDIEAGNISCVIDASNLKGKTGSMSLPVDVSIYNNNTCWVYGHYKININITENQ